MNPHEIPVFYSKNIVPRFKGVMLDEASLSRLKDGGFNKLLRDGVALEAIQLTDPYTVVIFPKPSPSRPYEIMTMVLPNYEGLPSRSSLYDFLPEDTKRILKLASWIVSILKEQAENNHHHVTDSYIYQHYNPKDLLPKTPFNGSISHLHLHIQLYGHSLSEFPDTFSPAGFLSAYDAAPRLLSDSGVHIFYEMFMKMFPDVSVQFNTEGCISFNSAENSNSTNFDEITLLQNILTQWDNIWEEFSGCFLSSPHRENNQDILLLPPAEATENVSRLCDKYQLSDRSRRVLRLIANNILIESPDTWRNFYHGPNGALGQHIDFLKNTREWIIAPRIFRSWSRHLPIIYHNQHKNLEWTTKNESGDGLVNPAAQTEIFSIQRATVSALRRSLESDPI